MTNDMTEEELKMYEKLYELMGAKVKFTSGTATYQGMVASIITGLRMVSLRHTSIDGGEYLGNIRFRFSEITALSVVESEKVVNKYPKNEYLMDILKNKIGQKYSMKGVLYNDEFSDDSDDERSACSADENTSKQVEFVLELPFHLKSQLPKDSVVIDTVDSKFTEAVDHIGVQRVIGVSFEGKYISRFGNLTWVCISTTSCVYLFDIETLKEEAFHSGLRSIFEEAAIKKVIHDCRFPSDCLAHRYSTQLTNVFDTQVADFVVSMQCYNDKYEFKHVSSLDCCLRNRLDVPPEFVHKRVKDLSAMEKSAHFSKRPISNEFRYDLIKNALYLILLHKRLAKNLLGPLHKNVDAYLRILARSSNEIISTLGSELSSPDRIPQSLFMNGIQTVKFQKPEKKIPVSLECKFEHPVTREIIKSAKTPHSDSGAVERSVDSRSVNKMIGEAHKENFSMAKRKSMHQKNNLFNAACAEEDSSCVMKNCDTVDSITLKPSRRHLDEVYHKLVNNQNLRSHHSESVINVKPLENYVSKFTVRRPFSECSTSNVSSSKEVSVCDKNISGSYTAAENISPVTQDLSDYSESWAILRAAFNTPVAPIPESMRRKQKNIRFVPAGMA